MLAIFVGQQVGALIPVCGLKLGSAYYLEIREL